MISFGLCSRASLATASKSMRSSAIDAVGQRLEPIAGHVERRAVGQMAAGGEIEPHERIARLHQRQEHRLIGLAPECGCTLAKRQSNSLLARSMASVSAISTNSQPP